MELRIDTYTLYLIPTTLYLTELDNVVYRRSSSCFHFHYELFFAISFQTPLARGVIIVWGVEPTLGSKSLKVGLEVVGFSLSTDSAVQVYK